MLSIGESWNLTAAQIAFGSKLDCRYRINDLAPARRRR
jgi:hypothetical protein